VRLYSARSDTGVGRKGPAETFIEINLSLLGPDAAGYLPLLFGARALADDGTITEILRRSADFATELGSRLRERLYDAVPGLAMAVAQHQDVTGALGAGDLRRPLAYEQTLTLLFRLLFVAYGEDRDLPPYRSNSKYAEHALKTCARSMAQQRTPRFSTGQYPIWDDLSAIFSAIDQITDAPIWACRPSRVAAHRRRDRAGPAGGRRTGRCRSSLGPWRGSW